MNPCHRAGSTGAGRRHGGAVTAELAVVLPAVVALSALLVWLVGVAGAQLRCVDAAREAARALARDESAVDAARLAREVGPAGAQVSLRTTGVRVEVRVSALARAPGLLAALPGLPVSGRAVAAREARGPPGGRAAAP